MTSYSLLGQAGTPDHLDTYTGSLVNGVKFSVSEDVTLTGIWWYSFAGAGQLPAEVGVFTDPGQVLVFSDASPSWSGAAGSGWVKYSSSQALSAGSYRAAAWNVTPGLEWYAITAAGWGPVTNGPLSCLANPNCFLDSAPSFGYPGTDYGGFNIWLDVEVTPSGGPSGTGAAALSLAASAPGSAAKAGNGHAAVALGASAPGSAGKGGSGHAAVSLGASSSGASARSGSGGAGITLRALATGTSHRSGTGIAALRLAALGSAPAPAAAASTGSWWSLDSVFKESRQEFDAYWSRPPVECPICTEPLSPAPSTTAGSGIELYCKFDGWQYPRDWRPEVRFDSGGLVSPL